MKEIIDSDTLVPCEVFTFPEPSPQKIAEKRCYSVDDICAILGVSRNYVYYFSCAAGRTQEIALAFCIG